MFETPKKCVENIIDPEFRFLIYVDGTAGYELTFTLPLGNSSASFNFIVNWGDGSKSTVKAKDASRIHTYAFAGQYEVRLRGLCEEFTLESNSEKLKFIKVLNWGDMKFKKINFYGASNLVSVARENRQSFKYLTNVASLFRACTSLYELPNDFLDSASNLVNASYAFSANSIADFADNLLSNHPMLTNVQGLISYKTTYTGHFPQNLFRNSPNIELASELFRSTRVNGNIPQNFLLNCPNITNFSNMFAYSNITGNCIRYWDNTVRQVPPNLPITSTEKCYAGCTKLNDYNLIPYEWKN